MPDQIPPALTFEEWEAQTRQSPSLGESEQIFVDRRDGVAYFGVRAHDTWRGQPYTGAVLASPRTMRAAIALANHALPDDDPRKITWAMVDAIREVVKNADFADRVGDNAAIITNADVLERIADALASYLPSRDAAIVNSTEKP